MKLIKNFAKLATNKKRETALKILEAGLTAIQPKVLLSEKLYRERNYLHLQKLKINLDLYEHVYLIGFGKGSAEISTILEKELGGKLDKGMVIDTVPMKFKKIEYTVGTHPLPSKANLDFTEKVLKEFKGLGEKDLVLVVICGGGSALFESPAGMRLKDLIKLSDQLINSGAEIDEINVVRKHISKVKGGKLARHLYPARIINLIFSDVPGNDYSVIASGPTVRSKSTMNRALKILSNYKIDTTGFKNEVLEELPKESKYFENVISLLMMSNDTALTAMTEEAKRQGYKSFIFSESLRGDAKKIGKRLIEQTPPGKILLAGGETTVRVTGKGKGGRNQTVALSCVPVPDGTLVLSFASDGVDYYYFGGALVDEETNQKASKLQLDPAEFLKEDNSYAFFEKTGDGIFSGKLGSNISDLIMVLKI